MIGKLVSSKAGHDKGQIYLVVAQDKDNLYLCDGKYKCLSAPKKKNPKHIQIINYKIEEKLLKGLQNKEAIDEQIKYEIKKYLKNQE